MNHILNIVNKANSIFFVLVFVLASSLTFAQITASDDDICAPTTVTFTLPGGANSFVWDFGDGSFSNNGPSVQHIYTTPGVFTVKYDGKVGVNTVSYTKTITVHPKPTAKFTATPTHGCIPLSVQFTDQSTAGVGSSITGWQWTYGDGGSNNIAQNPNYNFTLVGSFNVVLIATDNNGCTDDTTWTTPIVTTNKPPVANFTPSVLQSCTAPLTVSFANNSSAGNGGALSYTWDFGNGAPTSNLQTPTSVTYNTTGIYNVTLTVDEANGCAATKTIPIVVSKPLSAFALTNGDTICPNQNYLFNNLSLGATSYAWDFGDASSSNSTNPSKSYALPGTYNVKLTASANGCSDDTTIAIVVENVVPNFSINPTYSCDFPLNAQFNDLSTPTNIASWTWQFGDSKSSNAQNPLHVFKQEDDSPYTLFFPTTYPVFHSNTLTVTTTHGCTKSISKADTIAPLIARLQPDVAEGCVPLTVEFSDSTRSNETKTNWNWNFGDGNTSNLQNPTHVYNTPGEYSVTVDVTNTKGCRDTSYIIVIKVGDVTHPDFSVFPLSVCPQDTVTLTDLTPDDSTDTWHYGADAGNLSSCPGDASTKWVFNSAAGFQNISLTTGFNGCYTDTVFQNAVEVKGPIARLNYTAQCDTANKYNFKGTVSGADSWTWIFGEGIAGDTIYNSTDSTVTHYYAASGDYWARIIGKNNTSGCADFVDSVLVRVRNIKSEFVHDYVICENVPHTFDAAPSADVYSACKNGYRWDFGDGTPPDLTDLTTQSHTYADTGMYKIRLITTAITGCKDTSYFDQRVYGIVADFTLDKNTGCLPLLVNFTDKSMADTTVTKWSWTYGDGALNGTTQNTSHTYFGGQASYSGKLVVEDALGCVAEKSFIVSPFYPDTNFSATKTQVCTGATDFTFNATGNNIKNFLWDFGDGTPTATGNNITHAFSPAPGPYTVKLTVTDNNNCVAARTRVNYMQVQDYPVASFISDADNVTPLCYPTQIAFTSNSTGNVASLVWDLANGSPTLPISQVTTTYNTPGIYNAKLEVTSSYGCKDDTIRPFNVVGPVADFDISKTLICVGEEVTFTMKNQVDVDTWDWDFGGVVVAGGTPSKHRFDYYPPGGTNNVILNVFSAGKACSFPITKTINFHDAYANFGISDTSLCVNTPLVLTDSSGGADTWQWVINPGQTYIGQNPGSISLSTPGNYTISLRISDQTSGCKDTLIKDMEVIAFPSFTVSNNVEICQGASTLLTATSKPGHTYSWTPTTNLSTPSSASTNANPIVTTPYTVLVTNPDGCSDSKTTTVTVLGPIASFPFDTACIVAGQTISLGIDLGSNYTYDWTDGATKNLSCTSCPVAALKVVETGTYVFKVTDKLGCFTSTNSYDICVSPEHTVDVPSAFTPNEDGVNDIIYVDGWGIETLKMFRIFNRWGEVVFESSDIKIGWNGLYKSSPQPNDTYVYQVDGVFYGGEDFTKSGIITLIR